MPARKRISTRAIEEAPMDASSAISALPKQKQSVLEIASDGSSDSTARRSWCNATRAILAAAFVSDSLKIGEVTSAGPHHQMYPYGTSDFVMKTHARENLGAAAIMLDSCVEQRQLLAPVTSPSDRGAQEKPPPGGDCLTCDPNHRPLRPITSATIQGLEVLLILMLLQRIAQAWCLHSWAARESSG